MPVTRSQTGRLPFPRFNLALIDVVHEDDVGPDLTYARDDDHSDWEESRRSTATNKRPASVTINRETRSAKLSILPTLPLDILFEIFGHLRPTDLLNLARLNEAFRNTLMSRKSITVWKRVRKRMRCHVPECPPDVSEPQWADLLFGGYGCQQCGMTGVTRLDFALCLRVCAGCLKENLVYAETLKTNCHGIDQSMLDLIPYSNMEAWAHGHSSGRKYYWRPHVSAMVDQYGKMKNDIYMQKEGAEKAFEDFRSARIAHIAFVIENVRQCERWFAWLAKVRTSKIRTIKNFHCDEAIQRFKELGYEEKDLAWIRKGSCVRQDTILSRHIWTSLRAKLEPLVVVRREARLANEWAQVIEARKNTITAAYAQFQTTLVPLQWIYLPPVDEIYTIPELDGLIHHPSDDGLKKELSSIANQSIHGFIAARADRFREAMLIKLPAAQKDPPLGDSCSPASPSAEALPPDCLFLATAVFRCRASDSCSEKLISYHEVMSHRCAHIWQWPSHYPVDTTTESDPEKKFSFSERGSAVAASLITLLEEDVTQTTPEDLDRIDARFRCMCCTIGETIFDPNRHIAWSWRDCISHFLAAPAESHEMPKWEKLSEEDAQIIKGREGVDPSYGARKWCCNHCSRHLRNLVDFKQVVAHLEKKHAIMEPTEGIDFFYADPSNRRRSQLQNILGRVWKCLQCPESSERRFCIQGISSHAQAKHATNHLIVNMHYTRWEDTLVL